MLAVIHDITERKRAEESLKLFRALVEQSNDAVTISDRDTLRYIDVNERASSSLGYSREEMLSLSLSDIVVSIRDVQKQMGAALRNDGSVLFETVVRRKDGSTFPIEVSAREVLMNRRYLLAISRDITERRQIFERLRSSEARLALENRLAEIFLTVTDDQMFSEVLDVVLRELSSASGFFGFIDEQGVLVIPSPRGQIWEACKMQDKSLNFPPELWGGAWGRALVEKTAAISNQAGDVPDGHIPILRYMVTPILHGDNVIGILAVANKSTHYDQADQEMLNGIALYLAPVLRARLQRDAETRARKCAEETILSLARTDSLTGLANRRVLEETLPQEVARAQRLHEPLAAIFADLDHFKSINDEFGHQAGDQILASVGALLKSQLRAYALASRFGGDEFVLLLPGTTRDDSVIVAERIREMVASTTVPECPRKFTMSLGIASFVSGESGPELVARADEALYLAKHKGGNRVEVGEQPDGNTDHLPDESLQRGTL
jgi:diguanylate cyclase (GGDEF)-like protein/PAS domain S-box-containing protein